MEDRLLFERDVVSAVDKHTDDDGLLDDDITCILEEVKSVVLAGSKEAMRNLDRYNKFAPKQKRVELFEDENIVLERRGDQYFISLYDKEGNFQQEFNLVVGEQNGSI